MEKKIAIYCRVSTQQQTIDRQREDLLKFASDNHFNVEEEYIYVDVISGFKKGELRPQYTEMIKQVENGSIGIILFSEFSRLARNVTDLLASINFFRENGVELYFEKQNLWVKGDKDLGSTILLHVLAVMSSYEIELFAERSISGKIAKVQMGHGGGEERAYGYTKDENGKIVINPNEKDIVVVIFELYSHGKSTIQIADFLNAKKIDSPYVQRVNEFERRRKEKGLGEKIYKFDKDNLKWRPSTIARLLQNELYIGKRNVSFYKPDPSNPLPIHKREDREILYEYKEMDESLRIISDEMFQKVQNRLSEANYNKNNAMRYDNLLKHLIKCGECGSNFSVGKSESNATRYENGGRTYKCYGRVNRKDKPKICDMGAELRMWKFDGLIVQLSLYMFAEIDMQKRGESKISELELKIREQKEVLKAKEIELNKLEIDYKHKIRRLLSADIDDDIYKKLAEEENTGFSMKSEKLKEDIANYQREIFEYSSSIDALKRMGESTSSIKNRMEEIRLDKSLVKLFINEYIDVITVFRPCKLWCLIVVKYKDDSELWGTLKVARYKKDEMFYDPLISQFGQEFKSLMIPNWDKAFTYDSSLKTVNYNGSSEYVKGLKAGTYTFDEFNSKMEELGYVGSFPLYDFETGKWGNEIMNP